MANISLTLTVPDGVFCKGCSFFSQFSYRDQPRCVLFEQDVWGRAPEYTKCPPCAEHTKTVEELERLRQEFKGFLSVRFPHPLSPGGQRRRETLWGDWLESKDGE